MDELIKHGLVGEYATDKVMAEGCGLLWQLRRGQPVLQYEIRSVTGTVDLVESLQRDGARLMSSLHCGVLARSGPVRIRYRRGHVVNMHIDRCHAHADDFLNCPRDLCLNLPANVHHINIRLCHHV